MRKHHPKNRPRPHDSRDRRVSPYSLLSKLPISGTLATNEVPSIGITRRQQRKLDRKNKRKRKPNSVRSHQDESERASGLRDVNSASPSSRAKEELLQELQSNATAPRKKRKPNGTNENPIKKQAVATSAGGRSQGTSEAQDTIPADGDPESRQIRRLERLLGIKQKSASGTTNAYDGIFDESESDLLDLVKACDQTLERISSTVQTSHTEREFTDNRDEGFQHSEIEESDKDSSYEVLPSHEEDNSSENKHNYVGSDDSQEDVPYVAKWRRGSSNRERTRNESSQFSMKALQGLLNRVSTSNIAEIAKKIADLYPNDISTTERRGAASSFVDVVLGAINQGNTMGTTNPYLRAHIEVIFILGITTDMSLLANFVTTTITRLSVCLESDSEATLPEEAVRTSNILGYIVALCAAYELGVLSSSFMVETLKWVAEPLNKTRLDAELKFLQEVGPPLRKKDPVAFADVVKFVHSQTKQEGAGKQSMISSKEASCKLSMLAETIENIRNNRIKAVKSIAQSMEQSKAHLPFQASLTQLLDSDFTSTMWWNEVLLNEPTREKASGRNEGTSTKASHGSPRISKLAAALRLHTESRRGLLAAIMNSTSCPDAIQRIERLGAFSSKQKLKDLTYIITQCCSTEQPYNKFYALLANRVCQKSRDGRFAMEFTIQDALKGTSSHGNDDDLSRKAINLAQYLGDLWASQGLPLSMLRRVPDLEDIKVGEQNFYTAAFERMISQSKTANLDPSAPFSRLKRETVKGGDLFCSSLAFFLRRHVHPKMSGTVQPIVSKVILELERKT